MVGKAVPRVPGAGPQRLDQRGRIRGFWLGLIKRSRYEEMREAAGKGVAREVQVAVSPVTDGMRVQRHGGWLSQHVTWIRFQDLTLKWCEDHLF